MIDDDSGSWISPAQGLGAVGGLCRRGPWNNPAEDHKPHGRRCWAPRPEPGPSLCEFQATGVVKGRAPSVCPPEFRILASLVAFSGFGGRPAVVTRPSHPAMLLYSGGEHYHRLRCSILQLAWEPILRTGSRSWLPGECRIVAPERYRSCPGTEHNLEAVRCAASSGALDQIPGFAIGRRSSHDCPIRPQAT